MPRIRSISAICALVALILVLAAPAIACLLPMQGHACCKSHDGFQQHKAPLTKSCCSVSEQHLAVASTSTASPNIDKVLVAVLAAEAPAPVSAYHNFASHAISPPVAPPSLSSQLRI